MITESKVALHLKLVFDSIKARGGHAAIDFKNGELVLLCTKPSPDTSEWDTSEWGRGACPQSYSAEWVRLAEC
jgi:hypothetical protein